MVKGDGSRAIARCGVSSQARLTFSIRLARKKTRPKTPSVRLSSKVPDGTTLRLYINYGIFSLLQQRRPDAYDRTAIQISDFPKPYRGFVGVGVHFDDAGRWLLSRAK
jgi:hypothetical protein